MQERDICLGYREENRSWQRELKYMLQKRADASLYIRNQR